MKKFFETAHMGIKLTLKKAKHSSELLAFACFFGFGIVCGILSKLIITLFPCLIKFEDSFYSTVLMIVGSLILVILDVAFTSFVLRVHETREIMDKTGKKFEEAWEESKADICEWSV